MKERREGANEQARKEGRSGVRLLDGCGAESVSVSVCSGRSRPSDKEVGGGGGVIQTLR